jgi:hypothetical protein
MSLDYKKDNQLVKLEEKEDNKSEVVEHVKEEQVEQLEEPSLNEECESPGKSSKNAVTFLTGAKIHEVDSEHEENPEVEPIEEEEAKIEMTEAEK